MNRHLLIFGMGYTATHLADALRKQGWRVTGTRRRADADNIAFEDRTAVEAALNSATHILSSVPPEKDGCDPVLAAYGIAIQAARARWIGYLSSTGVYGDAGGAWVDESAPIKGRRGGRNTADQAWQDADPRAHIFRLPGIYGSGRSALERVVEGKAHRIALPDQVFSRIHVEDIASAIVASFDAPSGVYNNGVYNIADDYPCGQNDVIAYAARLLGITPPPIQTFEEADLSPMARAFYAENRRVANGKAKRLLGWTPRYATYQEGLRACIETTKPTIASTAPVIASVDQL